MTPDLLNFKKGWMSKLDEGGEWKKHWFVLTDAGLKYYRDSNAEEKDDVDGEIDLKSCVNVSEFDVEKNYGFQVQTREAVFTLSAMTAGIRRNWIEVLRKSVRPSASPDLTRLPDSSSDKENSHSRFAPPPHRPSARHAASDARTEAANSAPHAHQSRRFDYVELSPVPASSVHRDPSSQSQDEKSTSLQWEALLSRKGGGGGTGSGRRLHAEDEIEKKWAEFERLPLKEMSCRPTTTSGQRAAGPSANEALQREVASLKQQLEQLLGGRGVPGGGREGGGGGGGSVAGGCGPVSPCGHSLAAMERAHRQALAELQRQHERQAAALEGEKERLLREEAAATARVMEALKKKHKEELEREAEKAERLSGGALDSHTLKAQQQEESRAFQRELAGLSERYSQKCLELNRAEQSNGEREREISRKERDMEQLRKENQASLSGARKRTRRTFSPHVQNVFVFFPFDTIWQDLKARLKEEMGRSQAAVGDRRSEDAKDGTSCELQVLLRMKDNEIEYLHKEIGCLRNELQFLNTEKRLACKRYEEMREELGGVKDRSEREIQNLKEHLRLAMAALQEGQNLGNSLDH
ncbi:LOW QUALITY PROTEIN: TRIO and F-actin binding protein b [Nelusetta ayraudi]|uniref:LOW QUALITY PROTEIN: TRIO and F-actin binding protein b n=1 Tax=Nelusetta ayraudi TaxID=303726 RepID=UPI003F6E5E5C